MGDLQISLLRSYRDAITELEKTVCEVGIFVSVFRFVGSKNSILDRF